MFAATLPPLYTPGQYKLVVTATSPTLCRQHTVSFTVHPACFQAAMTQNTPVTLQVTLADGCPTFRTLTLEAERTTGAHHSQHIPLTAQQPGVFTAPIPPLEPGQTGQVMLHIRGALEGADAFTMSKGAWPRPATPRPASTVPPSPTVLPAPEAGGDIAGISLIYTFAVLNGILLVLGGAGFGCYRYYIQPRKAAHE